MRRRRSEGGRLFRSAAALLAALTLGPSAGVAVAGAQDANAAGAISLLLPLGARLVGVGGAGVAGQFGAESQLVNPAALGFATRREISLLHGQDLSARRDLLSVVIPQRRLGTFAGSGYLVNLGEVPATDDFGNQIGTVYSRTVSLAASYASTFGRDVAVGLTYRLLQVRFDCSGTCTNPNVPTFTDNEGGTASMVDVGAQYDLRRHLPLALGLSLRNLGRRLQVRDSEQSDALPTQLAVGARYDVAAIARLDTNARLRVSADVVRGLGAAGADPAVHVGAEGTFRNTFMLRGGWVQKRGDSGPSVGFGYASRRIGFDVARQISGLSVDAGEPPTFVALRYYF
ncbi:PorV/PorQ family protein [Roseisolibacter sp. H3M3-2]|uniref:PorV/PorQ family protein n=1 Tax=Roseisolibacter sp. H3M3-2 TaxID=3031323 RepID=UPI0023D9F44F|nr:PorV/PorQ family protein [Roseisolibacter sp. H3M3-2]MDF1506114.1 PorV/PorQ family protein [Roseisolibacter sp. H3M3-2]